MHVEPRKATVEGPADWFTGDVFIDAIAESHEPNRVYLASVHFTPGARTAWHRHTMGQTLYVTEGAGRVQSRGGDVIDVRSGDVISTPPDEEHWHGAAPDHFMTHLGMTGGDAQWGDHVTDAEYGGAGA
jgi:quercetin dioxygenase-like cupin family protein